LVYVGPAERGALLWVRELDELSSTPIAGTEGAVATPFFSPDGRQIGFLVDGTKLRTVSVDGGPVLTLSDSVNSSGGDWGVDGYIYFEVDSGIARIQSSGGTSEIVYNTLKRSEVGAEWPVILPGARALVFRTRRANQAITDFQIVAMKLPRGEPKVLMRGVFARYSPTGHLLVVTADGKLLAVPFDADKLEVTGSPIRLLEGIGVEASGWAITLGLSRNGTLVYTTGRATGSRRPVWVSREGVESSVDPAWQPQGIIANFTISPDGGMLAVDMVQNGVNNVWIKRLPAGPYSRLTVGNSGNMRPTWSADGRSIIYLANVTNAGGTPMMRNADGTGSSRTLFPPKPAWGQAFQTRDGRWLVLRSSSSRFMIEAGKGDIYGIRMADTTLVPLAHSSAAEIDAAVSPDGRWLAYASNESGVFEVYVRPFFDADSAQWQVSDAGGTDPVWSHNGRELFYLSGQLDMMSVSIVRGARFSFSQLRKLFSADSYIPIPQVPAFDVSHDGRFLLLREMTRTERNELIVVQNWVEEMKALARE
jgi:serine/threonine-protein kinase